MRQALRLLMAATAIVTLLTGCGETSAPPTSIELHVAKAAPSEPRTENVPLGSEVTMTVTSDIDDKLHVHGYELEPQLRPGTSTEVKFTASMAGAYEVETHSNGAVWLKLVVK